MMKYRKCIVISDVFLRTTITVANFLNTEWSSTRFVQYPPDTPAATVAQHAISEFFTLYPVRFTQEEAEVRKKHSYLSQHAISKMLKRFPNTKGMLRGFRHFVFH